MPISPAKLISRLNVVVTSLTYDTGSRQAEGAQDHRAPAPNPFGRSVRVPEWRGRNLNSTAVKVVAPTFCCAISQDRSPVDARRITQSASKGVSWYREERCVYLQLTL